jgi:hypothetical protein
MCQRITCSSCGKPSFSGCGAHVEQVLGNVPPKDRCHCREDKAAAAQTTRAETASFWGRLFGSGQ